jgi:hypothetical protein
MCAGYTYLDMHDLARSTEAAVVTHDSADRWIDRGMHDMVHRIL